MEGGGDDEAAVEDEGEHRQRVAAARTSDGDVHLLRLCEMKAVDPMGDDANFMFRFACAVALGEGVGEQQRRVAEWDVIGDDRPRGAQDVPHERAA